MLQKIKTKQEFKVFESQVTSLTFIEVSPVFTQYKGDTTRKTLVSEDKFLYSQRQQQKKSTSCTLNLRSN